MTNVETGFTRKGLNTRLREAFDQAVKDGRVESWGVGNSADDRLMYTVTIPGFRALTLTAGECADWLGLS